MEWYGKNIFQFFFRKKCVHMLGSWSIFGDENSQDNTQQLSSDASRAAGHHRTQGTEHIIITFTWINVGN